MAEANLFGINGITGVADTEASSKLGRREEKRGESERKKRRECDDRELIVFWRGCFRPVTGYCPGNPLQLVWKRLRFLLCPIFID